MKNDKYLKVVLTVIATSLVILVLQNFDFITKAQADVNSQQHYVQLPVNSDGTINVNVKSINEIMDVNISEVGGNYIKKALPIKPHGNILDVNINEVGGWSVSSGRIPVEN